jgi:pimeloyl-ACP methyl ester carboxylesterase
MKPLLLSLLLSLQVSAALPGWPEQVQKIEVTSSADHTPQPALSYTPPPDGQPKPLLVGLHTWSGDYTQAANGSTYAAWAIQQGWALVFPNFRGPNWTPPALGSDLAVQDVVDAVQHMQRTAKIDDQRIYLIGVSGGGHMALLMAGRHPEIWAGVSAWCGISDVAQWHRDHLKNGKPDKYAQNIEAALGGPPDTPERQADATKRSPLTWLAKATSVPLDIAAGVNDGRAGSVPFTHSLLAYNVVAPVKLDPAGIAAFYQTQSLPAGWPQPEADALYTHWPVVFRVSSANTRLTIFQGGHEILYAPALNWLAQQRKGQSAVWAIPTPIPLPGGEQKTQSGL